LQFVTQRFNVQGRDDKLNSETLNLEPLNFEQRALVPGEPPVVDHESAVLDDFNSGLGEDFRRRVVANARLEPD
jgi:hypothetical protein